MSRQLSEQRNMAVFPPGIHYSTWWPSRSLGSSHAAHIHGSGWQIAKEEIRDTRRGKVTSIPQTSALWCTKNRHVGLATMKRALPSMVIYISLKLHMWDLLKTVSFLVRYGREGMTQILYTRKHILEPPCSWKLDLSRSEDKSPSPVNFAVV